MLRLEGFELQLIENLSSRKWSIGEFSLRKAWGGRGNLSNLLVVASLAVLLWEYVVTLTDEVRHIWWQVLHFSPITISIYNPPHYA